MQFKLIYSIEDGEYCTLQSPALEKELENSIVIYSGEDHKVHRSSVNIIVCDDYKSVMKYDKHKNSFSYTIKVPTMDEAFIAAKAFNFYNLNVCVVGLERLDELDLSKCVRIVQIYLESPDNIVIGPFDIKLLKSYRSLDVIPNLKGHEITHIIESK